MHSTRDYSKSPTPAFDAVEDLKDYLGRSLWEDLSPKMSKVKDPMMFRVLASISGIEGFPVRAWYELYHGQGSWEPALEEYTAKSYAYWYSKGYDAGLGKSRYFPLNEENDAAYTAGKTDAQAGKPRAVEVPTNE